MGRKRIITLLVAGMICTSILTGCSVSNKEINDTSKEVEMASVPQQEEENKEVVDDSTVNKESNEQKEEANANNTNNEIKSVVKDKSTITNVDTPKGSNNTTKKPSTNVTKPSTNVSKPSTNKTETNNKVETPTQSEGDYLARVEDEIFNATNAERQKQGLPALKRNSTANKYARSKSLEMLNLNYFDHKSPNNGYIQDIAKKDGWKYSRIGENIYTMTGGQASSVSGASITNSWMNSEGHRKNILNSGYTEIGIGVTFRNGKLYATQIFYTPL